MLMLMLMEELMSGVLTVSLLLVGTMIATDFVYDLVELIQRWIRL